MTADEFAVHALCAGMLTADKYDERDKRRMCSVRVCDALDWRRALAVHEWYVSMC